MTGWRNITAVIDFRGSDTTCSSIVGARSGIYRLLEGILSQGTVSRLGQPCREMPAHGDRGTVSKRAEVGLL